MASPIPSFLASNVFFRLRLLRCAGWKKIQDGIQEAVVSDPAAALVKGQAITVTVRYYEGTTPAAALAFAGVHGDEDEGTITATSLRNKLDSEYAAKPQKRSIFHTFLIENLRAARDTIDPDSASRRWVDKIEPNRNFPLAGEGIASATARKGKLGFELVDPDVRRFPDLSPRKPTDFKDARGGKEVSTTILPENRILMNLITCIQPSRAVSLHSHGVSARRGDGPGVFVDPRGGFDTDLDAPFTHEGRADDVLAGRLLQAALTQLKSSKLSNADQTEALLGNQPGSGNYFGETVHYSYGAAKARGTSFGMWASTPITGQGAENRRAMQTITLELPKWIEKRKRS
ncbi:MAG TPA: hypothetical protein VMZ52_03610, partial [Bryobacteraceae bacterium]|nr:hypothetical protein [Bryobacteraceae bacterium]